jgi:DNA-binding transcriptional MerR regulator
MCDDFAVTARALRFYEDEGLIRPERRGTARFYSDRDRARLTWILRGKRVGFSLAEIRELLDLYDIGDHQHTQMLETRERCRERVASLKRQRLDIDATIDELESFCAILDDCLTPKEA